MRSRVGARLPLSTCGGLHMRRAILAVVALSATASWADDVVFCAPKDLREPLAAALKAKHRQPVDLSEVDDALFGTNVGPGAKALVAEGKPVTLPSTLPKEVRADFATGLAGCQAREDQSSGARQACAAHLVEAVWQRLLDRLRPEKVVELKALSKKGSTLLLELAVYGPQDAIISGGTMKAKSETEAATRAAEAVERQPRPVGARPNISELPSKKPPPAASLDQGSPQVLAALRLPDGCRLPSKLVIEPAASPLAVTLASLWSATASPEHADPKAPELRCSLDLTGPAARPNGVVLSCGATLNELDIYPGTRFGDAGFQAMLARVFASNLAWSYCKR